MTVFLVKTRHVTKLFFSNKKFEKIDRKTYSYHRVFLVNLQDNFCEYIASISTEKLC